ncbi:MAG: hypothetical protein HYX96_04070, partial [Chloroflexi bacterium]|nr:hypothetical protein [Chloroflexota bacterium]
MDNKNLLIPVSDVGHVIRLGYYSALAAAIFTILWAALALAFPSPAWEGISAYAKGFATVQIINTIPAMMIMPSMI